MLEEVEKSFQALENPFRLFYDAVIGPIVDLLGSEFDELVIFSEGALCFTPWAAIVESIRIRTVPSLTSYQLILSVPEGHHKKTGASILNTRPLTGREATKPVVIKRMSSVGLIHIAAHGDKKNWTN